MCEESRKLVIAVVIVVLWAGSLFAQGPDTLWTKTYGGTAIDEGWSVQQTSDGGYIIAGNTASFGAGGYRDVYLVKTDANGGTLWTRTYGGSGRDDGWSVQQTSDGGYIIAGLTDSFGAGDFDIYLIKTDANGDTLWTKTYGGSGADIGFSVQQTSDGGYIVAGSTRSFGAGDYDIYLIKTNANGDTLWARTYGGADSDNSWWVQQTSDGGYITGGRTRSIDPDNYDVYLVKTDADGDTLWTRTYGGSNHDDSHSVQQTHDGGYIIVGCTRSFGAGDYDFYVIRTAASGDTLWTRTYGGPYWDIAREIEGTCDGGYVIAGDTYSFGAGGDDAYLVKMDATGNTLWTRTYGGPGDERANSIQQTFPDGGYVIAGNTNSSGAGSFDVWLVKTEADLCLACVDVDPDVLNPRSGGRWVTAYIELPEGHDPEQIDLSTVLLNETVPAEAEPTCVGDYDEDGIADRMVKFSRGAVIDILPGGEQVEVRVSGEVAGGSFAGADTIRVLMPKVTYPNGGELLEIGQECTITWEAPSGYSPDWYGVYCTVDDAQTWNIVAESIEATSCTWVVPDVSSDCCRVLVEAYDAAGIIGYDMSDGSFTVGSTAGVPTRETIPIGFAFHGGNPNPFTGGTVIQFDLPERRRVRLTIHDVGGRLVRQLIDEVRPGNSYSVQWDGKDSFAGEAPAGVYFVRIEAGNYKATGKIVQVR